MTFVTILGEEPTGSYASTLPVLGLPLHSVGVSGYANRWATRDLTESGTTTVTSWKSTTNGTVLAPNQADRGPTVVNSAVGGVKALVFDGVDDALRNTALPAEQRTFIIVARFLDPDGTAGVLFSGNDDDIQLLKNYNNEIGVFAPGSGIAVSTTKELGNLWHVYALRLGATAADAFRDGTKVLSATSSGLGLSGIRMGVGGGDYSKIEVAEFVTYPTALTDADMLTIYTELKKTYTAIA